MKKETVLIEPIPLVDGRFTLEGINSYLTEHNINPSIKMDPHKIDFINFMLSQLIAVFKIKPEELQSRDKKDEVLIPRKLFSFFLMNCIDISLKLTGLLIGRDHSSICARHVKPVEGLMYDKRIESDFLIVLKTLYDNSSFNEEIKKLQREQQWVLRYIEHWHKEGLKIQQEKLQEKSKDEIKELFENFLLQHGHKELINEIDAFLLTQIAQENLNKLTLVN